MGGDFDHSDFVDPDFAGAARTPMSPAAALAAQTGFGSAGARPPSREEINRQVTAAQQALVELKRQQEDLERERAQLEDSRRRRLEYEQGRTEMLNHLTRGVGLLDEAEQNARRDAEQLSRTVVDLKAALEKVSALNEEAWTATSYQAELTRALTTIENARMEWNSANLKWPVLSGPAAGPEGGAKARPAGDSPFNGRNPADLARLGLALTWPVAAAVLAASVVVALVLARR